jgi:hypothetical protein
MLITFMNTEFLTTLDMKLSERSDQVITVGRELAMCLARQLEEDNDEDEDISPIYNAVMKVAGWIYAYENEVSDPDRLNLYPRSSQDEEVLAGGIAIGLAIAQIIGMEVVPIPDEELSK